MSTARFASLGLAIFFTACATDELPGSSDKPAGEQPVAQDPTIYDIQQPGSAIADGTHVVLDATALRVTASTDRFVWIQEVDASGLCEELGDAARVAHHAIRVERATIDRPLAIGQRVRVEGDVIPVDGRRWIGNASVTALGASEPYRAHCNRDATQFADPALEAVLVQTAGTVASDVADESASWVLRSCFAPNDLALRIEGTTSGERITAGTWRWVTGNVQSTLDSYAVQPRTSDDLAVVGDDACL